MDKEYLLRKKPKFTISVRPKEFQIHNRGIKKFNGSYKYINLDSIEFKKEKVNWLYTLFSLFLEIVTNSNIIELNKDKNKIILSYNHEIKEIKLFDCNIQIAQNAVNEIENRI